MTSGAKTVRAYLQALPANRRRAIQVVRAVIRKHLPEGYVEIMQYGMIGYAVPLSRYPPGYHCRRGEPLPFAGLASQKKHLAIYLMSVYADPPTMRWFLRKYKSSGKRMDMGKCCVRFRTPDDLPLALIGKAIARTSVDNYIRLYERARGK